MGGGQKKDQKVHGWEAKKMATVLYDDFEETRLELGPQKPFDPNQGSHPEKEHHEAEQAKQQASAEPAGNSA